MADDIVDPFEGMVDPFEAPKTPAAPKAAPGVSQIGDQALRAVTDIPSEIGHEASEGWDAFKNAKISKVPVIGPALTPIETAKGLFGAARAAASPFVGAAKSLGGHGMTAAEMAAGEYVVNPIAKHVFGVPEEKLQHPDPEKMYENSKGDVEKALSAMPAARAVPRTTPAPPIRDPFGVTLTEGERTGNLPARQFEQAAARGEKGEPAQRQAQQFLTQQRPQELAAAKEEVLRGMDPHGGQVLAETPSEAAGMAQQSLQAEAARTKAQVDAAYRRAREAGGDIATPYFDNIVYGIKEDLVNRPDGAIVVNERTPNAANMVDYLNDRVARLKIRNDADPLNPMGTDANGHMIVHGPQGNMIRVQPKGVSLEGIDEWRKTLSQMRGDARAAYGTNPADARASQAVLDAFDARINQGVNSDHFSGPRSAVDAWNTARDMHAQRMRTWGNDATGRQLKKIVGSPQEAKDPINVDAVANALYSASGTKAGESNILLARRVRQILGEDSPEWASIRQGMIHRLISVAEGNNEKGVGTVATRLNDFLSSSMAGEMLTPAQRSMLVQYANLNRQLQVPQMGANWPNTAAGVAPHIKEVGKKILGAVGAVAGHFLGPPIVGDVAGYAVGKALGSLGSRSENARNLARARQQMPLVGQAYNAWQRAVTQAQTKESSATARRVAIATTNLVNSLTKLGVDHPTVLKLLQGAEGPGNANAEPPARASGGVVNRDFDSNDNGILDRNFAEGGEVEAPFDESKIGGVAPGPDGMRRVYIGGADHLAEKAGHDIRTQQGRLPAPTTDAPVEQAMMPEIPPIPDGIFKKLTDEKSFSPGTKVGNRLFGTGGEERFQTWPERMLRSGAALPGDVLSGEQQMLPPGLRREDYTDKPAPDGMTVTAQPNDPAYERAQDLAGMAGGAGLTTGATEAATLGSTAFLRPALKHGEKLYKGKVGQEHADLIPDHLYPEFQKRAMSGEDISEYNFGFMNHKGQFLDRQKALDYARDNNLLNPKYADKLKGELPSDMLLSDSGKPGAALSALEKEGLHSQALATVNHAQPFYSAVEQTVLGSKNQKMHGEQWANWLKNQPGVKPDELQYTGIDKWLREQKGPVTKEQVSDYIDKNKVQVNDVVKGGNGADRLKNLDEEKLNDIVYEYAGRYDLQPGEVMRNFREGDENTAVGLERILDSHFNNNFDRSNNTKYHDYQLPGGENYREHLLTLPSTEINAKVRAWAESKGIDNISEAYRRYEKEVGPTNTPNSDYRSSHWDEPNILAHVRTNDRDVGGVPSLHLEEIQSDWHQQGRKQGYKIDPEVERNRLTAERRELQDKFRRGEITADSPEFRRIAEVTGQLQRSRPIPGVPDAPFKTTWPELAMKRMIRKAAEEGKTRISWTPGEAQAARYDLSKNISKVYYNKQNGDFQAKGHDGRVVLGRVNVKPEELESLIGKDVADKLLNDSTFLHNANEATVSGLDLKVGGEGMKGFYDNMMPKMVEKLGKQYGVKVKRAQLGEKPRIEEASEASGGGYNVYSPNGNVDFFESRTVAESFANRESPVVYYFDIPPKMKEDFLKKGAALFSDTSHGGLLNQNAEKDSDKVVGSSKKENAENVVNQHVPARAAGGRVIASNINHAPSEAQKAAGNYAKDHVNIQGLNITIENAKGATRSGKDASGKTWSCKLPEHYGYIKGSEGADGDHLDVYVGPHIKSDKVFVVNQIDLRTGKFDETKSLIGFRNLKHALETYAKAFSDGKGLERVGSIVPCTIKEFKEWVRSDKHHKPYIGA